MQYINLIHSLTRFFITLIFMMSVNSLVFAQQRTLSQNNGAAPGGFTDQSSRNQNDNKQGAKDPNKVDIVPHVKSWILIDDMSLADTIPVDTLLNLHQINDPIWKKNLMNVTLGVLGSPSRSTFYPTIKKHDGNIFYNSLLNYIPQSDQMVFYNTLTPYTNITYQMGYPKRRSEEYVHALFTQNINRRTNIGFQYSLSTSIGKYDSQRTDQSRFRVWNSYDGDYYRYYLNLQYHHSDINENGGILNDTLVTHPKDRRSKSEEIPVRLSNTLNKQSVYDMMFSHSLDLGHIERLDADSNVYEVAPAIVHHTMSIHKSHSHFRMNDLQKYDTETDTSFFTYHRNIDKLKTHDNRKYFEFKNIAELKMNEEFNELLKFGLRAYFGIDVHHYRTESLNDSILDPETEKTSIIFNSRTNNEIVTYLGGQIFKNVGENLKWKAGFRTYFTDYRAGDLEVNGEVDLRFPLFNRETNLYGKAWYETQSPSQYEKKYYSNHFSWNKENLHRSQHFKFEGGLRMPDLRMKLYAFGGIMKNHIYFGYNCIPTQKEDDIEVFGVYGEKHFSIIGFNSNIRIAWQTTTDDFVMPLPELSLQASNYYECRLGFGRVMLLQIGFDVRYNTKYYAPKYMPALLQFYAQNECKVGDYGYFDPFINFHLKRIRVYVKYDHINSAWRSKNYFHTTGYPAATGSFKFGLSWNFYD
ncbi:MAG: putative porin [Bacteroidales bacterium]|nr:putative porin [Bacteroidales bacterium]